MERALGPLQGRGCKWWDLLLLSRSSNHKNNNKLLRQDPSTTSLSLRIFDSRLPICRYLTCSLVKVPSSGVSLPSCSIPLSIPRSTDDAKTRQRFFCSGERRPALVEALVKTLSKIRKGLGVCATVPALGADACGNRSQIETVKIRHGSMRPRPWLRACRESDSILKSIM